MLRTPFWRVAYLVLAAADFAYFLYSHRLPHAVGSCVFLVLAIGWNLWFGRLAKENEVTRLNLVASADLNHGKR